MNKYITTTIEATMDALRKHGLIKVFIFFIVLITVAILLILAWQSPDIIRALQGR